MGIASEPGLYDRSAWLYDFTQKWGLYTLGALGGYSYAAFAERIVAAGGIGPGARVLDAGCGTGYLISALIAAVGPSGSIDAIDFSEGQLERAKAKAARLNHPAVRFVLGRIEEIGLRFGPDTFDAVYCAAVLPVLADPGAAIGEMVGVLKPGGRLVVWTISIEALAKSRLRLYWRWAIRAFGLKYHTPAELTDLFVDAGCEPPTIEFAGPSIIAGTAKRRVP